MSKWINVNDRLPKTTAMVLVAQRNLAMARVAEYIFNRDGSRRWDVPTWAKYALLDDEYPVTHWQPIPEPPYE